MSIRLNSLVEHLGRVYRSQQISFDESYDREVKRYYSVISTSPKTSALSETDRLFVIAVASDRAVRLAYTRRLKVVNAGLLREALLEYKGPIRPPDDECEEAANHIYRNRWKYEGQLPKEIREFFVT